MLKLLYFARLREMVGVDREEMALPEGVSDVQGLRRWLAARGGLWEEAFNGCHVVRAAVNQTLVPDTATVSANDEVAFFPPVTGG
jgi:molybdopterin synthase sulfur carrier subunit